MQRPIVRSHPGAGLLLVGCLALCACASPRHAGPLPKPQEFQQSIYQLQTRYPELQHFDPTVMGRRNWGKDVVYAEDVVAAWGEPDRWRMSAWNLVPTVLVFRPKTYWTWHLADKDIEAKVLHHWYQGWQPMVRTIDIRVREK